MIDIRKLKELVRLMVENDLTELDLQDQDETVSLKRGDGRQTVINHQPAFYGSAGGPVSMGGSSQGGHGHHNISDSGNDDGSGGNSGHGGGQGARGGRAVDDGLLPVASPMVGTYYSKPTPDAEPFATTGTNVGPDTTVCLIEAMKVFNEIKAEIAGTIERVMVQDGDAVEFGQPLFMVRPS